MAIDKDEKKDFIAYLKRKGVNVSGESVHIDDADKVPGLYHDFRLEKAKKSGLPPELAAIYDGGSYEVSIDGLERDGQDPKPYDCEFTDQYKNHDHDDTWGGTVKGEIPGLYRFLTDECDIDPEEAKDLILEAVRDTND